ncbi:DUF3304 domain-containing protein [Cupriavidus taiwanensis]|uniref:DUF3304 domain-containing protein n=1 Tax=Cupriavidus taiwanensis TaxID=164546 RepID=UPI00253F9BB0|nr:DUF3304 domain-containing protein [Cupriavidus taiwanensis]MDK3022084.1 DUF3304 domain-containing protein [Cupriavidus taiwanensis]
MAASNIQAHTRTDGAMARFSTHLFMLKWRTLGLVLTMSMLAACGSHEVGVNVVGYNHTARDIGHFSVNGRGGGFIAAHEGGGKFACCVPVPQPWKPGLTATVGWTDEYDENYQERVVPVPRYDDIGDVAVHFLRNGEVKVFVTMYALWHPDYPLRGPDVQLAPGREPTGPFGQTKGISN